MLLQILLVKPSCRQSIFGKRLLPFSSETFRFVRRVRGSATPAGAIHSFRQAPPVLLMKMETYQSKQRYKAGFKANKIAAARMRMTFWRDETLQITGLSATKHGKLWLKKTLCFDGYSTSTFFDQRRAAFLAKHRSTTPSEFQCFSEEFIVPKFLDYGIWTKPRNILIGSLPYLIFTFGGISWLYRMFVEVTTTSYEVDIVKMVSTNDRGSSPGQWKVVSVIWCNVMSSDESLNLGSSVLMCSHLKNS